MAAVAALPDDAQICGYNGVSKSKIAGAIILKGLTSLHDVRAHTNASAPTAPSLASSNSS
jgi:nitrite reductase (NADH) large subunit